MPETKLQTLWFEGGKAMAQHALIWYADNSPAYTADLASVYVKACILTRPRPSRPLIVHATGFNIDYAELADQYGVDDLDGVQLIATTQDELNELRRQHPAPAMKGCSECGYLVSTESLYWHCPRCAGAGHLYRLKTASEARASVKLWRTAGSRVGVRRNLQLARTLEALTAQ